MLEQWVEPACRFDHCPYSGDLCRENQSRRLLLKRRRYSSSRCRHGSRWPWSRPAVGETGYLVRLLKGTYHQQRLPDGSTLTVGYWPRRRRRMISVVNKRVQMTGRSGGQTDAS
jgi:hypothetical protein